MGDPAFVVRIEFTPENFWEDARKPTEMHLMADIRIRAASGDSGEGFASWRRWSSLRRWQVPGR
jgi:hypothetical protein